MREIKFRAWDEFNRKFWFWEMGNLDSSFWNAVRVHKEIAEQYTGIKDKNGKEIYEGDLLEWTYYYSWYQDWFVAIGKCSFTSSAQFSCRNIDSKASAEGKYIECLKDTKKIGNIHENPELLEVKNEC